MLTFEPTAHQYFWEGRPVINVTRVLAPFVDYSRIPPDTLEKARQEGIACHKMVELDCLGDLDTATLPEWLLPRYRAWCAFKEDSGFTVWAAERRLYHRKMAYAGTTDIVGEAPRLKGLKGPGLFDVKRSFFAGAVTGLQTAAYTDAWNESESKEFRVPRDNRFALRLDADGKYRLQRFDDAEDYLAFLAALTVTRWKEKHNVRSS